MSTLIWQPFHSAGAAEPFDEAAFDRERARMAAAQASLAEARELLEQLGDEQREAIAADIVRRRAQLPFEDQSVTGPLRFRSPAARPEETPEPGAFERSLEETIQRRIDAAGMQTDAARLAEREFIVEIIGHALGEVTKELHERIDALEHDNLKLRGLLHEHALGLRSLLPDPHDLLSKKEPLVLFRAGSRHLTERAANRSRPATDSAPWFSQPFFNADDD